jgi:hypothetical protein
LVKKIGKKFIDPEMTDDTELANEASLRATADQSHQSQINTNASNIAAEITARTSADTNIQNQINNHHGLAGNTHPAVTQAVNGFMTSADKVKLDTLVARVRSRVIGSTPVLASGGTAFVAVGDKFSWNQNRNLKYKNGVLIFNAIISNRDMEVRVYDTANAVVLGISPPISVSGQYVLAFGRPASNTNIEIQIRQTVNGGTPSIDTAVIEFDTV